jgi:hypothetical protein
MSQIFYPSTNTISRVTIFGVAFFLAGVGVAVALWVRSSYVTRAGIVRNQPVPFSHDHHVSGLGIDCRFCHTTVEVSPFAGMPSTEVCMGCHTYVWKDSPLLEPVRASWRSGQPLHWNRVHDLADFVYFNHSIHVAKGVSCEACHGIVGRMPLMRKAFAMHMEWCLECHRHSRHDVRRQGDIYRVHPASVGQSGDRFHAWPDGELAEQHASREFQINQSQLTNCSICHR